jgi:hypothetical protein
MAIGTVTQTRASRLLRFAVVGCAALGSLSVVPTAAAAGYELVPGGLRRGTISLRVEQAGQSASASPVINPVDPLLPDAGWTGANITLGGAPPFANVTAQGEGRYWLTTTPDAIDLRVRANASRNINGGINTATAATATSTCSVPFSLSDYTRITVTFSASRTGFPIASTFQCAIQSFPAVANIFSLDALGSETISFTLDPGTYRISAGANATPGPNASAGIEVIATISGLAGACRADFNADGFLDFTDFDDFVIAFEGGSASGDFNADGFLDFTDFDDFVNAFEGGC